MAQLPQLHDAFQPDRVGMRWPCSQESLETGSTALTSEVEGSRLEKATHHRQRTVHREAFYAPSHAAPSTLLWMSSHAISGVTVGPCKKS